MSNNEIYKKLSEGLGGCYERVAFTNIIQSLAEKHGIKSMLELNATYIAGVPGFNSVIFNQAGYDVTITVRPRDYQDTLKAWMLIKPQGNITIIEMNQDVVTPFADGEYDLVWNHLAFEQYANPLPLVKEMARISKKMVINLTLSPYNYGFILHKLMHWAQHRAWDHGYAKNAIISTMKRIHQEAGLKVIETGGCDTPPWMDTVDEQMGGSMTYLDHYPKGIRDKWVWCSADPACREHPIVKGLWSIEKSLPNWFKVLMSHHLYCASVK